MAPPKAATQKALQAARALALRGKPDEAIAALAPLVVGGSTAAASSLLALRAFRGEWPEVLALSARVVADPGAVASGHVFDDVVRLIAVAARAANRWDEVRAAADAALAAGLPSRHGTIVANLSAYAARAGAPPHELIRIFGAQPAPKTRAQYDAAVAAAAALKKKRTPRDFARHLFALAVTYDQPDEIVRLFDATPQHFGFSHAVDAARVLVGRGETGRAWSILSERLGSWSPVDPAEVAPVVLLVDERLATLATPGRCGTVLTTPKGSVRRSEALWCAAMSAATGEPLQFDRVETTSGEAPGTASCAGCGTPLVETYFLVGDKTACETCARAASHPSGPRPSALAVVGVGAGAVLASALLVYGVRVITGYELGLISIVVGLIVGGAVRWAVQGRGTRGTRWLAASLTYVALALTYAPDLVGAALKQPEGTGAAAMVATITVLLIAIAPILAVFSGPLSIVISGIAIWEAWKLNRPSLPTVTGPHRLQPAPAAPPAPDASNA